jgi:hypothetical protein
VPRAPLIGADQEAVRHLPSEVGRVDLVAVGEHLDGRDLDAGGGVAFGEAQEVTRSEPVLTKPVPDRVIARDWTTLAPGGATEVRQCCPPSSETESV